ncbi:MAG TPA: pitrilysin family protein [Thermodesulfobacteriota bacterium]
MVRKSVTLAFIALLFILASLAGEAVAAERAKPYRTVLDNGLTVVIEEERSAPVVSMQMWVKVGSADETKKIAGISHVFEHMLFKGTKTKPVGQIANMVESVGGDINAYTSFDNTVFHLTIPSRHFSTGLDVISDAVQNSSMDPDELKKELEVVLEELRMNEDNPGRRLFKSILGAAYGVHPYGRPVIGYVETVSAFTRKDIMDFYKKWYVPNNMVLVIAGDVDRDETVRAVKAAFKGFKKSPLPKRDRPSEPEQRQMSEKLFNMTVQDAQLGMAFHIPAVKDEDTFAIDVLQMVLSGGETSRLYKKLKIEDELVHGISGYAMSLRNPGLFFITAVLEPGKVEKTVTTALEEVARLGNEGPDHQELQKAKFNIESDFIYSRETMDGIAGKLGYFEATLGDLDYERKYIDGIRKVTPDDVKRIVAKYFNTGNMTVSVLLPAGKDEGVTLDRVAAAVKAASESAREEAAEEALDEKRTTKYILGNGVSLIVKEVHSNPTVAFYATFPGGLRFEAAEKNGIGNFTAGMLTMGTVKRTREELSREMEEMAGGVSGFSGWNSTGASGKFLSMFFDKGLGLLADVLMNPTFPETEITKLRADTLAAIQRQEDNLASYTFKLLYRELFHAHPYGLPVMGTKESISALTRDDLVEHHHSFFVPERMVLTVVGDVDRDVVFGKVTALFGEFKKTAAPLPIPPVEAPKTAIERTGAVKEREQTHVGIAFLGTTIGDEDSFALRVMTEVLSGQGGRLFLELRDKRSLAYSVSAFSREGVDPGIVGAYIATAPGKKEEAVSGILKELERMAKEPVSAEELNRAKRSIIGNYEIGLQEVSSQASDMANNELYGLGYDFSKVYPEKIDAVTAEDIMRVAKKYLDLNAYVISVVGPNGEASGEPAAK